MFLKSAEEFIEKYGGGKLAVEMELKTSVEMELKNSVEIGHQKLLPKSNIKTS
jgi:hypothetical protein